MERLNSNSRRRSLYSCLTAGRTLTAAWAARAASRSRQCEALSMGVPYPAGGRLTTHTSLPLRDTRTLPTRLMRRSQGACCGAFFSA